MIETQREHAQRTATFDYEPVRTQRLAFKLSAAVCGPAGTLRALDLSVGPVDSLHWPE